MRDAAQCGHWTPSTKSTDYYAAVRLYNGHLAGGVAACETLRLDLVKYYDYASRPLWHAVRSLADGEAP